MRAEWHGADWHASAAEPKTAFVGGAPYYLKHMGRMGRTGPPASDRTAEYCGSMISTMTRSTGQCAIAVSPARGRLPGQLLHYSPEYPVASLHLIRSVPAPFAEPGGSQLRVTLRVRQRRQSWRSCY
jgi:hypothetical protein